MIFIAVDVGTTNIDMAFLDTDKDCDFFQKSFHNRQSLYGSDVINRINTVKRDKSFIGKLKELAVSDILSVIDEYLSVNNSNPDEINKICLSGNTTMISLFLEYDISDMGESPYPTVLDKTVISNSRDIFGKECKFDCDVILTGCVSAFIGGDILSGIICLDKFNSFLDRTKVNLLIDLGTNGEMVLNYKGKLLAASAACGPAFEASLKIQGVYGASGISALAALINSGKLSKDGCLNDEYIEKGIRVHNILITSDIIREILLAKAAIASCIENLYKYFGLDYELTDNVYISGGFGSFLKIDDAVMLGIIPKAFSDKAHQTGNTSLIGAEQILLDDKLISKLDLLSEQIEVLLLADEDGYNESLIKNMFFTMVIQ